MTWLPFKQWRTEEGIRQGVTPDTIAHWAYGGRYPGLRWRRKNGRVVFVHNTRRIARAHGQRKGEIRLGEWVAAQAAKENVSRSAIWMRLWRGRFYPSIKIRRVSRGVQFIRP